jgi:hypothetical protein
LIAGVVDGRTFDIDVLWWGEARIVRTLDRVIVSLAARLPPSIGSEQIQGMSIKSKKISCFTVCYLNK